MDADTPRAVELSLPQAFLLLATNDKDGRPEVPVFALRTTLAGAILAELDLLGAIELQGKHVRATGTAPATDFQQELELIRGKSRPHTPKQWVAMLEGRAEVQRVYEGMESLGILERVGEGHRGWLRARRYAEKDHAPEAALLARIEAALSGAPYGPGAAGSTAADAGTVEAVTPDAVTPEAGMPEASTPEAGTPETAKPRAKAPDDRTVALIALLQASGLLAKLFPAADKTWADELAKDYWPAHAVEDELRLIRIAEEETMTM